MTRAKDISKILTDADISGNIDVDGVTNLDVVDIDGALTQDGGAVFNEASADVDFRVESNGDANMLFVDGGTDRVGMGTATPASTVHVRSANPNFKIETTGTVASGGTVYNTLRDSTGSDVFLNGFAGLANCYQFATIFANGFMRFLTGNQAEAIRIHSNQVLSASAGIALGVGTANTASNVLDDYEEGTWTPTSSCTSGNGSLGHASQVGHYTKVGNMVNITCYMSLNSISGASGTFRIAGVPFTSKNVGNGYITGGLWMNSTISGQIFDGDFNETLYLAPNDTTIRFFAKNGAGANAQLDVSHLGAGSDFMVNITYRV